MSVLITGKYLSNKKIEITHEQSGTKIFTVAPLDNQGDGSSFSPTDLVAAALGSCVLTIIAIIAERDNFSIEGAGFEIEKIMQTSPRRIAKLPLKIYLPQSISPDHRIRLETASLKCPVKASLLEGINVSVDFEYCL